LGGWGDSDQKRKRWTAERGNGPKVERKRNGVEVVSPPYDLTYRSKKGKLSKRKRKHYSENDYNKRELLHATKKRGKDCQTRES